MLEKWAPSGKRNENENRNENEIGNGNCDENANANERTGMRMRLGESRPARDKGRPVGGRETLPVHLARPVEQEGPISLVAAVGAELGREKRNFLS